MVLLFYWIFVVVDNTTTASALSTTLNKNVPPVIGDVYLNTLTANDVTIAGTLNVRQYNSQNINLISTTTTNYQMIVSEDLSLNGKMTVSGNVGIGTTNPAYALQIIGPENGVTLNCNFPSNAAAGNDSTTAIRFNNSGYGFQIDGGLKQNNYAMGTFSVLVNGQLKERVRITETNVGIGTTNPQATLDISGNTMTNSITKRTNAIFNSITSSWFLLGRFDSTAQPSVGASFILDVTGGSGFDNSITATSNQCGGKTTIYGRSLNNTNTTTLPNLDLSYKFEGGSLIGVTNVIGVQAGSNRNQYDIYIQCGSYSQCTLNVDTVTMGSFFTINPTISTTVSAPSTTNSLTVATGQQLMALVGGRVGIGSNSPTQALDVAGIIYSSNSHNVGNTYYAQNTIGYDSTVGFFIRPYNGGANIGVQLLQNTGTWQAGSDKRIKKNIIDLKYGLKDIKLLNAVNFDYIQDDSNNSHRMGFIAQEVLQVIPEAVSYNEQEKIYFLGTTEFIPTIIKAIQEQQQMIETLQTENQDLKNQIQSILARLDNM